MTSMAPLALVVDDEDSIRELIEVTLQLAGYRTVGAADGPTALALAHEERPDVVTLDIMMPGMDGWEVAARLDADPATQGVPIVVVSGKPLAELANAPEWGLAAAVLSKPFDFVAFVDAVAEALYPHLPRQRDAHHDVPVEIPAPR